MSLSLMDKQRRQLEQLMKKSSSLLLITGLEEDTHVNDDETPATDDATDIKDKSQKKSFDYSNYIRNKRQQTELSRAEQLKTQRSKEAMEFQEKKDRKESELHAKTAKKRAARQKKLNRLKQSKLEEPQMANEK